MADKDIKENVAPAELAIAESAVKALGITIEDVIVSAQLGVEPSALIKQRNKELATKIQSEE